MFTRNMSITTAVLYTVFCFLAVTLPCASGFFTPSWKDSLIEVIRSRNFARKTPKCIRKRSVMTYDGVCNNGFKPLQGAAHTPLLLLTTPLNFTPSNLDLPSPRLISNVISHEENPVSNKKGLTEIFTFFGQLIDHTIVETEPSNETAPIPIPADDPHFPGGGTLSFVRSKKVRTPRGLSPVNSLSSYLDASSVYGTSEKRAKSLRSGVKGKLRTSGDDLMPLDGKGLFFAGDKRASENPALQSMHILFLREHNRVCDELAHYYRRWSDEQLFRMARKIVAAEIQAIIYYEFLPAILGRRFRRYRGYHSRVDASISSEFSTVAYRVGHTLINKHLTMVNENGKTRKIALRKLFFKTKLVQTEGIDNIIRGILNTKAAEVDVHVTSELRNFLTLGSRIRFDLVSLNIQRGRDHGVPTYNGLRRLYGLRPVSTFKGITSNKRLAKKLALVYGNNVWNVDAFIGGLAEDHAGRSSMGPTFTQAWTEEFLRMRDGNRHYFENWWYFPRHIRVRSPTVRRLYRLRRYGGVMRSVILLNTDIDPSSVPRDVFVM